jgi:hypothetical protein
MAMVRHEAAPYLEAWSVFASTNPTSGVYDPNGSASEKAGKALDKAESDFLSRVKNTAQNMVLAENLKIEASFIDRIGLFRGTVVDGYAPFCTGDCDIGWLEGMAGEMAYQVLLTQRFPGNGSSDMVAASYRQQIEGHIKEQTGVSVESAKFEIQKPYNPYASVTYNEPIHGGGLVIAKEEETSAVPTVLGVTALALLGWVGLRTYQKKPLLPKL